MKYVALLAFNKIVLTHSYLVSQQEDVIMGCIDSPDMSIRLRALDLVVGMVSSDNLMSIVGRLMRQLRDSPQSPVECHFRPGVIEPAADSDEESPEIGISSSRSSGQELALPDDYKIDVITRILEMCSSNNYGNLVDFDWYIDILIQLIRNAPVPTSMQGTSADLRGSYIPDISEQIGDELRTVAVKVKAIRPQATGAAETMLISMYNDTSTQLNAGSGALKPISWIVGEYASCLVSPEGTLTALLHITKATASPLSLIGYLQAVIKIFSILAGDDQTPWTAERKTMISLLMARVIHALEPLAMHPDLEVQERAVEFSELLKLAAEASSAQEPSTRDTQNDAPLLLTQAIPSLFTGAELNSVAIGAQRNVPIPSNLDLDQPINANLNSLLRAVQSSMFDEPEQDELETYYHQPQPAVAISNVDEPAINRLSAPKKEVLSYQGGEESYLDPDIVARRRAERAERNKDDPFYIAPNDSSGRSTPLHQILQSSNGPDLDIDAIPIMQLEIGKIAPSSGRNSPKRLPIPRQPRQRIEVAQDETLATSGTSTPGYDDTENNPDGIFKPKTNKGKPPLLQVDSSHIGAFSLEDDGSGAIDFERQQKEDAEMAKAMKEVEKLRLEMQRASERIHAAEGVEGTVIKKKKKKVKPVEGEEIMTIKKKKTKPAAEGDEPVSVKKKKVKKAPVIEEELGEPSTISEDVVKSKKKKKKPKDVALEEA